MEMEEQDSMESYRREAIEQDEDDDDGYDRVCVFVFYTHLSVIFWCILGILTGVPPSSITFMLFFCQVGNTNLSTLFSPTTTILCTYTCNSICDFCCGITELAVTIWLLIAYLNK